MTDPECVRFLQWALPQLRMRWAGFRRIRRRVCKRIAQRLRELQLPDTAAYQAYLQNHADEWAKLDVICRVSISRFYRDRQVFRMLEQEVLPQLANAARARHEPSLRVWSAGCASGEEPYTLTLLWHLVLQQQCPGLALQILATDVDPLLLRRAQRACYPFSSVKNLPPAWREQAFEERAQEYCLRPAFRQDVIFQCQDVRDTLPAGPFHLVLCRNLVFTYFAPALQKNIARQIVAALRPGGVLVLGVHEKLPELDQAMETWSSRLGIYRKPAATGHGSLLDKVPAEG